jgi:hypothetical protein
MPSEKPNLSFSHIWASSPAFLIPRYFFGLSATSAGWATAAVQPQPGPVLSGSALLPTVKGVVGVEFTQTAPGPGGCFMLRLSIPGGMSVRAYLPLWGAPANTTRVRLDGQPVALPGVAGDYVFVDGISAGDHDLTTC